jgi:hypothetical protein
VGLKHSGSFIASSNAFFAPGATAQPGADVLITMANLALLEIIECTCFVQLCQLDMDAEWYSNVLLAGTTTGSSGKAYPRCSDLEPR